MLLANIFERLNAVIVALDAVVIGLFGVSEVLQNVETMARNSVLAEVLLIVFVYAVGIRKAYQRTRAYVLLSHALHRMAAGFDALESTWMSPGNTLAIAASVAWIGGMLWLARDQLPFLLPVPLAQYIAALAVIPALIGIVYLLAMRTSRREATRFRSTAQAMRAEAASLERTVAAVSRSLDANRRQLADQITTLMAMGDGANERLAAVGRGMALEIGQVAGGFGILPVRRRVIGRLGFTWRRISGTNS